MTNYVVETSLRDSYASIQLSPELVQQALAGKTTLLLKEILAVFPEADVTLTSDSYIRVRAALIDVLTRKPTRQERKRKMITEQVKTYNATFKTLTASFVYAYQAHLLSFKYTVGDYAPSSSLSPQDEDEAYRQFEESMSGKWDSFENEGEFFTSPDTLLSSSPMPTNGLSEKEYIALTELWTGYMNSANDTPSSLVLTSDVVVPKKSENQLAVEALLTDLQVDAKKFRSLKLTAEQEYTVESVMVSCQQIETLITGSQEFSSSEQQETVYEKAIPALKLLNEQFASLQEQLNSDVLRELSIMESYLASKSSHLGLTKNED